MNLFILNLTVLVTKRLDFIAVMSYDLDMCDNRLTTCNDELILCNWGLGL